MDDLPLCRTASLVPEFSVEDLLLPSPPSQALVSLFSLCLSSTREFSEEKVWVSIQQCFIIKFLTAERVQPSKILQRHEKQFGKHVSPELKYSNGVKPSEREERERESGEHVGIIVHHEHQSPDQILTMLTCLYRIIGALL